MNLGIGDIGRYYKKTYKMLGNEDKKLVLSLCKTIGMCLILTYAAVVAREMDNSPFPAIIPDQTWTYISWCIELVIISFTGVLAALLFTLFDRLGVITPIEANIKKVMLHTKEEAENLAGYNEYIGALNGFGLKEIMAATTQDGPSKMHIEEGRMDAAIIALFDKCEAGSSIKFMNSFVNSDQEYYNAIVRAVRGGVNFRLMLMLPNAATPATQSRFKDYPLPHCSTIELFMEYIVPKYRHLDSLYNEILSLNKKKEANGRFDIRYYSDSLNFPLILIEPGGNKSQTVAYTGFYAGVSSESMPYVQWCRGQFDMVETFISLFEKKWEACKGKRHLFPENVPNVK